MKKYYKLIIVVLFFFAITIFLLLFRYNSTITPEILSGYKTEEMKINGKIIKVEIADTLEKQEKGLSGRKFMPESQGMLFVFPDPDYYSFWMKDMNFSLDFIWINDNKIVEITKNVKLDDYQPPRVLVPKNKVDKVLEINAGMADKMEIREGDMLEF